MATKAKPVEITETDVNVMVKAAGLNLRKGRAKALTTILSIWLGDAHELNRKMSAQEHWAIVPKTIFTQSR